MHVPAIQFLKIQACVAEMLRVRSGNKRKPKLVTIHGYIGGSFGYVAFDGFIGKLSFDDARWAAREAAIAFGNGEIVLDVVPEMRQGKRCCYFRPRYFDSAHEKMAWFAAHARGEDLYARPRADGYWKGMEED